MDWFLSAVMIVFYYLMGNKWKYVWHYAIFMNTLWIIYSWHINQPGLAPSAAFNLLICVRNLLKWRREE